MRQYKINKLPNGLRVALLPRKSKVVYCGFAIHSGSSNDPEHLPGLAHFVEHTIFKGTTRRKSWHIINRMELVGGELNAYTTKDTTFVYTAAPRQALRRSVELLNDLIRHATFPAQELEKEKVVIEDEINIYKDSPSDLIFDDFEERIFAGHPMAHPILGNSRSLKRMQPQDCIDYVRSAFHPSQMIFFCMGQVSDLRFDTLCTQLLSEPFLERTPCPPIPAPVMVRFEEALKTSTHQAHTLIGGGAPTLADRERTEAALLMNILAGPGMNSRLSIQLREQRGWVYGVESSLTTLPDIGWWQIYFGSDPANASKALQVTLDELKRLQDEPLTPTALRARVKQAKGQAEMGTEQSESVFLNFGRQLLLKGHYNDLSELFSRLDAVTPDRLQALAQKLFDSQNISQLIYLGK